MNVNMRQNTTWKDIAKVLKFGSRKTGSRAAQMPRSVCFLRSQPLKNMLKNQVFIRIHFFMFFKNLMVSGTSWDLILEVWDVLRVHFHDSWRYLRLLEISMNSNVLSDTPRILRPLPGEGKSWVSRAHYYRQFGGYSIQNTTHSMKHCHTGSEDVNVRCKCKCKWCMKHMLHSLMAPGKQGPADVSYSP